MKKLFSLFFLLVFLLATVAVAQNVAISPHSIIVNPLPRFEVNVFVDREDGSGRTPSYVIGDPIRIGVSVSEDAYVYLFNVRATGEIQQILPNRQDPRENYLRAGQTYYFPPQGATYTYTVGGPTGLDKVIALASKRVLDTSTLARFQRESDLYATSTQGEEGFARSLSIIVSPLPQEAWVTDTTLFHVVQAGQQAPAPVYGTLVLRSNPSGANVYVNDQFVGRTPVHFETIRGQHRVRFELSGYGRYETTVTLSGGQRLELSQSLSASVQTGNLSVSSSPSGAGVYLNNEYIGQTPLTVSRPAGQVTLRLELSGYAGYSTQVNVVRGETRQVSAQLERQAGQPAPPPRGTVIHALTGLLLYPGAALTRLDEGSRSSRVDFETGASLESVYDHLHGQLTQSGWERSSINFRSAPRKVEASYRRGSDRLSLDLNQQGQSGRFRLDLELRR